MAIQKDIELLALNIHHDERKMPPDVKQALCHAITALYLVQSYHPDIDLDKPLPESYATLRPRQAGQAARVHTTE